MDHPTPEVDEDPFAPSIGVEASTELLLLDRMARFRRNPLSWLHEIILYVSGTGWRAYDSVIGQPCFYPGYTDKIKTAVLSSPVLIDKIKELTEMRLKQEETEELSTGMNPQKRKQKRRDEIEDSLVQIVEVMVDKMICKMESKTYIRTAFYCSTQLLTHAYSGVHVSRPEVMRLREIAALAAQKKQSIIFLPRHSSHIDYVTLHLICYRLGLTLPVAVAGDNLNFPLVGSFLQSVGAMWIRRSFDSVHDPLYATVVQAYLDSLLQNGYNLECFIEGTRSRTGKLLNPRFGILGFFLDSVISGRTEDAYICPVSLQYDKVVEVDSYVTELMGRPKEKENLADFLSASSVLSLNFGRIYCRFHEPWSLRDFIREQTARQGRQNQEALASGGDTKHIRNLLLRTLGYRVLSDINDVSVVTPSALIGTVLLTLRGRGVGISELTRRVEWLCGRIQTNGGQVAEFQGMQTQDVVVQALQVLGPELVGLVDGLAEPTYYAVDRFKLSFYRNMTIHLFISEALIAASLYTKVKQGGGRADQRIEEEDLKSKVTFLSQVFRGEFIFPAGQGLQHNLDKAMQSLVQSEVLEVVKDSNDTRQIGLTNKERENGRENFDFYCFLIWPFCDGAWLGAISLLCLVPPLGNSREWINLKKAQDTAQFLGRTLYHQGDLSYFEAINKEVLKNIYNKFQEEQMVIVGKSQDANRALSIRVAPDWMPERDSATGNIRTEGRLWNFIESVSQYRREGKNRRDGAAVSRRVLVLTAKVGSQLFDEAQASGMDVGQQTSPGKVLRRRSKL